jgi:hypothetical protein
LNAKEIISSGILELYAMGRTTEEENSLVQSVIHLPEVQQELEEIEQSLLVAAGAGYTVPPAVKSRLDDALFGSSAQPAPQPPKVIPIRQNSYQWYAAAASVMLLISLGLNFFQFSSNREIRDRLAQLENTNTILAGEIQVVKQDNALYAKISDFFRRGEVTSVELKPVPNRTGQAMVYYDRESGQTALNTAHLPALTNEHQYQLWALVDGKPVDLGVIPNDSLGKEQITILRSIKGMQAFAITREVYGGKPQPNLEELVVMGQV